MYQPYVDKEYYYNIYKGTSLPDEGIEKQLHATSRNIDTLTFNRIQSFEQLTDFQKEIVQEVVCQQADFEYTNQSLLNSPLSAYSINGVSVNLDTSSNVKTVAGVKIPKAIYDLLKQTGLTYRGVRY